MLLGFVTSDFLLDKWKGKHPIQSYSKNQLYTKEWLKFLRKWYIEVTESKDAMTRYLSLLIQAINLSYITVPTVQLLKKAGKKIHLTGKWIYSHRKPILKTSLSAALILLLVYGAFQQKDRAIAFFNQLTSEQENSEVAMAEGESQQTLTIQVEGGANVRNQASLDGAILFTLEQGKEVSWSGEKAYEEKSGNWYYIESERGDGWINEVVLSPADEQDMASAEIEMDDQQNGESVPANEIAADPEQQVEVESMQDSVSLDSNSQESNPIGNDTEVSSESTSSYYQLNSVDFGHGEALYHANLEERMDTSVENPYSLSITEEMPDATYVRSKATLNRKPQNLWATSIMNETYQLVAVAYEDGANEMDIFLIDPNGMIENNNSITVSEFSEGDEGFMYVDANTGIKRLLSIESGQLTDREL